MVDDVGELKKEGMEDTEATADGDGNISLYRGSLGGTRMGKEQRRPQIGRV